MSGGDDFCQFANRRVAFRGSETTSIVVGSACRFRQKGLDFLVEIPRDRERVGIPIGSQQTAHPVVGDVDAVRAFVDEYRDGSIGPRVRNVTCHLLHDERIAHDESGHSGLIATRRFPYDGAMVKFHEEHQALSQRIWTEVYRQTLAYRRRVEEEVVQPGAAIDPDKRRQSGLGQSPGIIERRRLPRPRLIRKPRIQ